MDAKTIEKAYINNRPKRVRVSTFPEAQTYADKVGQALTKAIGSEFEDIAEEELADAIRTAIKTAHGDVSRVAAAVQAGLIRAEGLGLGVLEAEFDDKLPAMIAEELAGRSVSAEVVANLLMEHMDGVVDETIRRNSEANERMGLVTRIVRSYSGRGLRAGTPYEEDCEWCLERCGDWDNYEDAYNAGCFERHPGCGCTIDYHVGKTHTIGNGVGNWRNV